MKLYLLRHAEAHPGSPDSARNLTEEGLKQAREIAKRAVDDGLLPESLHIWHSPYVRAVQTMEVFREVAKIPMERTSEVSGITPYDDARLTAEKLDDEEGPLILIGHNPHLEDLATHLLTRGQRPDPLVRLKKAGLIHLVRERRGKLAGGIDANWQLRWMLK